MKKIFFKLKYLFKHILLPNCKDLLPFLPPLLLIKLLLNLLLSKKINFIKFPPKYLIIKSTLKMLIKLFQTREPILKTFLKIFLNFFYCQITMKYFKKKISQTHFLLRFLKVKQIKK